MSMPIGLDCAGQTGDDCLNCGDCKVCRNDKPRLNAGQPDGTVCDWLVKSGTVTAENSIGTIYDPAKLSFALASSDAYIQNQHAYSGGLLYLDTLVWFNHESNALRIRVNISADDTYDYVDVVYHRDLPNKIHGKIEIGKCVGGLDEILNMCVLGSIETSLSLPSKIQIVVGVSPEYIFGVAVPVTDSSGFAYGLGYSQRCAFDSVQQNMTMNSGDKYGYSVKNLYAGTKINIESFSSDKYSSLSSTCLARPQGCGWMGLSAVNAASGFPSPTIETALVAGPINEDYVSSIGPGVWKRGFIEDHGTPSATLVFNKTEPLQATTSLIFKADVQFYSGSIVSRFYTSFMDPRGMGGRICWGVLDRYNYYFFEMMFDADDFDLGPPFDDVDPITGLPVTTYPLAQLVNPWINYRLGELIGGAPSYQAEYKIPTYVQSGYGDGSRIIGDRLTVCVNPTSIKGWHSGGLGPTWEYGDTSGMRKGKFGFAVIETNQDHIATSQTPRTSQFGLPYVGYIYEDSPQNAIEGVPAANTLWNQYFNPFRSTGITVEPIDRNCNECDGVIALTDYYCASGTYPKQARISVSGVQNPPGFDLSCAGVNDVYVLENLQERTLIWGWQKPSSPDALTTNLFYIKPPEYITLKWEAVFGLINPSTGLADTGWRWRVSLTVPPDGFRNDVQYVSDVVLWGVNAKLPCDDTTTVWFCKYDGGVNEFFNCKYHLSNVTVKLLA